MAINFGDDFAIKLGFTLDDIRSISPELKKYINTLQKESNIDIKFNTEGLSRNVKELENQLKKAYSAFGEVKTNSSLDENKVQAFTMEIKRATGEIYKFKNAWDSDNNKFNLIDTTKIDNSQNVIKKQTEILLKEKKQQDEELANQMAKGRENVQKERLKDVENEIKVQQKIQQERKKAKDQETLRLGEQAIKEKDIKLQTQKEIEKTQISLNKKLEDMSLNPKKQFLNSDIENQIEELKNRLNGLGNIKGLDNVKQEIKEIGRATEQVNQQIKNNKSVETDRNNGLFGKFMQNAKQFTDWYITANVITQISQGFRQATQDIVGMNTAMTDLGKVVDLSSRKMQEAKNSAVEMGKETGKSSLLIMNGMAEFGRVTKNLDEIKELSKYSAMASNVTDLTPEQASKGFITVTKQMGMELKDVSKILDSMNEIQNNYRTSAEDLIQGISETGSVAKLAGLSLQQLEGYITSLVSATGDSGNEVGTGLKSIMSRIYRVGSEGAEAEGKPEIALKSIGVNVRDASGEFRKFNDIISDTQSKWSSLSKTEQMYVAQQVGGTHYYQKFITLMSNYKEAIKATDTAMNSQGSAMKENEKVMQSFQGKLNKMKVNLEEGAFNSLDDGLIQTFLNLGLGVTGVIGKLGLLKVALVSIITIVATKNKMNLFSDMITSIGKVNLSMNGLKTGFMTLGKVMSSLSVVAGNMLVGLSISFAIDLLLKGINYLMTAKQRAKELNDELISGIDTNKKKIESVEPLLKQQEELENKLKSTTNIQEQNKYKNELLDIQRQIADIMPTTTSGFDDEGKAIANNTALIKENLAVQKEKSLNDAFKLVNSDEYKDIDDDIEKYFELQKKIEDLKISIKQGQEFEIDEPKDVRSSFINGTDGIIEQRKLSTEEQKKLLDEWLKQQETYMGKFENLNKLKSNLKISGATNQDLNNIKFPVESLDIFTNKLIKNAEAQQSFQKEGENTAKTAKDILANFTKKSTIEKANSDFDDSTSKIKELQNYIDTINKNGMNGDTAMNIVKNYKELAGVLDNNSKLMDGLNEKIKEQEQIQEQAFEIIMGEDQNFYNTKIKNNESYNKAINDFLGMFVDEHGQAYDLDINNYNNYNSMKADALIKLQDGVNRFLSQFVGENGQAYKMDLSNFTNLAQAKVAILDKLNQQIKVINKNMDFAQSAVDNYKRIGIDGMTGESAFMNKYLDNLKSQKDKVSGYIEEINKNIGSSLELKDFVPKSLSSNQFHNDFLDKDKKKEKEIDDMGKLADRYYEVNNALQKLNNELEKNNQLLTNADGEEKIRLEKERIDLLYKEIKAQQDLREEKLKESEELRSQLSNNGFKFDTNGNLTNDDYIDSLVSWANGQNSKEAQENVKNLSDMIKKYTELILTDIPKIDSAILGIKNDIISAQKGISDVLKKQRDERIKAIQDVTDATKKSIQEQKDAYNKAFEIEEYEDKLKEGQDKLKELQSSLLDAQRMGDQELIKSLGKQIEEQRKFINNDIRNKEKENANDIFDKELSNLDETAKKKIDEINKKLSDEEILKMVQAGVISLDEALNNIENSTKGINDTFIGVGISIQDTWIPSLEEVLDKMTKINAIAENINMSSGNISNNPINKGGIIIEQPINIEGNVDSDTLDKLKEILKSYGEEISDKIWKQLYDGYRR